MAKSVLMPDELTAENGAKYLFMGEFKEQREMTCQECETNEPDEYCECCEGSGTYIDEVIISWDNIKNIYALAVKELSIKDES